MLGMFGVKSISVFLPMLPLQLAVGFLFRRPIAVLINALGYALGAAISYYRGRSAGAGAIGARLERYRRRGGVVRGRGSGNRGLSGSRRLLLCKLIYVDFSI